MKHLFSIIITSSLLLTACSTTKSFVNDDTYSVRASDLAIGESLTDETSYSAYKSRKQGKTNDQLTYADEQARLDRLRCLESPVYCSTCNCTYTEWVQYQRMERPNHRFNRGFIHAAYINRPYGIGYSAYNYMGMGMGMGHGGMYLWNYGTNPLAYGYYSSLYPGYSNYHLGSYYGYGPYGMNGPFYHGHNPNMGYGYGYNYGYGGYGFGGNNNGWSNSGYQTSNTIRGPRGTFASGNANPNGRASNANVVKSTSASTPSGKGPVVTSGRGNTTRPNVNEAVYSRKEVSNHTRVAAPSSSTAARGNASTIVMDRNERPSTSTSAGRVNSTASTNGRATTTAPSGHSRTNVEYQRAYPSRTTAPSTTGRVESGASRQSIEYSSPQRSSSPSGSYSSPSRSSSPSSGGMSGGVSGGSSRSGGAVGGSTGRR